MCYPSGGIVAATFNDKLILETGDRIGEEAIRAGIDAVKKKENVR